MAVAVGLVAAIGLTMVTGQWLDAHRAPGSEGVLAFLVVSAAVVLGVEMLAGWAGDRLDDELRARRHARRFRPYRAT